LNGAPHASGRCGGACTSAGVMLQRPCALGAGGGLSARLMRVRRALGMAELAGRYRPLKGPACCTVRTSRRSRWRGRFLRASPTRKVGFSGGLQLGVKGLIPITAQVSPGRSRTLHESALPLLRQPVPKPRAALQVERAMPRGITCVRGVRRRGYSGARVVSNGCAARRCCRLSLRA
jgi:hypothetical protein